MPREKKNFCAVTNEDLEDCPGYCCHCCPHHGKSCDFECDAIHRKNCPHRITKAEFVWRKVFGNMEDEPRW